MNSKKSMADGRYGSTLCEGDGCKDAVYLRRWDLFLFFQQIASSPVDKYMRKKGKFSIPVKVVKHRFSLEIEWTWIPIFRVPRHQTKQCHFNHALKKPFLVGVTIRRFCVDTGQCAFQIPSIRAFFCSNYSYEPAAWSPQILFFFKGNPSKMPSGLGIVVMMWPDTPLISFLSSMLWIHPTQ